MKKIYKPKRKKINKIGIVNDKEESVLFIFLPSLTLIK